MLPDLCRSLCCFWACGCWGEWFRCSAALLSPNWDQCSPTRADSTSTCARLTATWLHFFTAGYYLLWRTAAPSQLCRSPRPPTRDESFLSSRVITWAHLFGLLLIAILTYVNVVGLRWGTLLQNLSTWTKFAAMAAFVVLGFAMGKGDWSHFQAHGVGLGMGLHPAQLISAMGVALIAVFWAYDG